MPLKLYRRGQIWHYRGKVAGRYLRGSCETADKDIASRTTAKIETDGWKCHFDGPQSVLTFSQAALMYRSAGKSSRFLAGVEDYWKDTLVKDIKPGSIRQMAMTMFPKAKNSTRNRQAIVPCQAVINYAAESELCPFIRVKRFKVEKKIKSPFTLEWVNAFCEHANPYLSALVLFMFSTGARISEALAVRWEHVNLQDRTILIPRSKIAEQRLVHLPPRVLAALANLERVPNRSVFWYRTGGSMRNQWLRTIKKAGIKTMMAHSGRHGFATTALRNRIDPKTAAKLGGWKNIRVFMETYAHAIDDLTLNEKIFDSSITAQSEPTASEKPMKIGKS